MAFTRHLQFCHNIVQDTCKISLEKVIRFYSGQIGQAIHFNNTRMLISAFFKVIFQQNFQCSKKHFYEICYFYITVLIK